MKQSDDNIGYVIKKFEDIGQLDNTIVVFTTDNGAETITFRMAAPRRSRAGKGETWEGGMRAPTVVRWPGSSSRAPSRTNSLRRSIGCPRLSISRVAPRATR